MAKGGDSLFRRTTKSISVLFFETTKHSRIMKKRMRIGSLQKLVKADYRDLGILVYDALMAGKDQAFLAEGETKALVENISRRNHEMERLRESIARIARAKKHFDRVAPLGEVPLLSGDVADKPAKKRSFLGLKKRKAAEELAKMAAKELSGPSALAEEKESVETAAKPAGKPSKAKRSFFGFKKKEKAPPPVEADGGPTAETGAEPQPAPKAKAKRGFLGLGKKRETPPKKQAAKESPPPTKKARTTKSGGDK